MSLSVSRLLTASRRFILVTLQMIFSGILLPTSLTGIAFQVSLGSVMDLFVSFHIPFIWCDVRAERTFVCSIMCAFVVFTEVVVCLESLSTMTPVSTPFIANIPFRSTAYQFTTRKPTIKPSSPIRCRWRFTIIPVILGI